MFMRDDLLPVLFLMLNPCTPATGGGKQHHIPDPDCWRYRLPAGTVIEPSGSHSTNLWSQMLPGDRTPDQRGLHGHQLTAFLLCLGSTFSGQKQYCMRQWIMYSVTWQMTVLAEDWQARKQKQNQTQNNGLLQQEELQDPPLQEGPRSINLPPGSWMTSKVCLIMSVLPHAWVWFWCQ